MGPQGLGLPCRRSCGRSATPLTVTRDLFDIQMSIGACWKDDVPTTEYVRFVGIMIDGVTSPSGENEHLFWNNPCIKDSEISSRTI